MYSTTTSKRAYNWYISLVAAACMVLYGYDASVYNSVQDSTNWINWMGNPSNYMIGLINTLYSLGAVVGGWFFGGPVADIWGRKFGMGLGCFITIIATFIQCWTPKGAIGCFLAGRVLVGVGQGIALTSGPIYIGELAPPEIRGKIMAFWQTFYSVGSFICFWINYACGKHKGALGEWDWKMVVIWQIFVPAIIIIQLPFLPGTPRWFIKKNNNVEAARAALRRVRDTQQEVEDEILMIREAIEFEAKVISSSYSALWKDRSVRHRLYLAFVINAGQQVTGQGTLNTYSSKIYKKVWTSMSTINLINALNATFGILFTLNATWTVDRFGRKFLLIGGAIGMGLCMVLVATVETQTPLVNGVKSEPVAISLVFLLFLFIFFYKPTWGATVWIYTSEIFSMNVRAQAVGMASQTQNLANAVVQQFFPIFLANDGFYAFYMFAGVNFLLAIFVYFMLPETKQVRLEDMDTLFGGQNHVEKGADLLGIEEPRNALLGENGTNMFITYGQDRKAGGAMTSTRETWELK